MNEAAANIVWLPFDPRDWVELTPAFGRLKSVVAPHGPKLIANNHTATFFNQCVHDGRLELALVAPDLTYRLFDEKERRKLTIRVPLDYKEGCGIEPYHEGLWYVRRSGLEERTAILVTPVARAGTPPASPIELPRAESGRDVDAADAPVQETQMKSGEPQLPATDESKPEARAEEPPPRPPDGDRPVASTAAKSRRRRKKEAQEQIAEAAKKIWADDGIVPPDLGPADLIHALEDLHKREALAKGPKEKPRDCPSWSSCKRFLEDQRRT